MTEYRTILETRLRALLKPALDSIFAQTIDTMDVDGVDPNIIANARENAATQSVLWTNALVASFADALETASSALVTGSSVSTQNTDSLGLSFVEGVLSGEAIPSGIDHNALQNYDAMRHFLQTEITKISSTITGILQSIAGTLQGTPFIFGTVNDGEFLKRVGASIVSATVTGTGTSSPTVVTEQSFGQASSPGAPKEEIAELVLNSGVLTEYAFLDETFTIKKKIQLLM